MSRDRILALAQGLRRFLERQLPHLVAEGALVLVALWPTDLPHTFREALGLAAAASFLVSAAVVEAERWRRRGDRERALEATRAAARVLLALQLSASRSVSPAVQFQRRTVTIGDVSAGERIDIGETHDEEDLRSVHAALGQQRLEFAALTGTQLLLLDVEDQRHALTALGELDAAIAEASRSVPLAWRCRVLRTAGVRPPPLDAYRDATLKPAIALLHERLENVADAAARLLGAPRPVGRRAVATWPSAERAAADVVEQLTLNALDDAVDTNWLQRSSLAGLPKFTMRALALAPDIVFETEALNGWGSLRSMLAQERRFFQDGLDMVEPELGADLRERARDVLASLEGAMNAAHQAGEAARVASNVHAEQRAKDAVAVADESFALARKSFIEMIREGVRAADAILAITRSAG